MEPPPGTAAGQEEQELRERAFFSWAEFSRFFDAWCQQRLALFFVKSSMHLARCRWASAPPLYTLIDVLKYSYVRLVCKDVRAPSRPPQPGCPAFIIVKLSPLRDRLVVTECQLTHSHPACPLEFAYYFRPGHLLANACLPVRTTNKISKQFVAPADVRRLLSYCKGRDHGVLDALHVLEGLFRTDPEAKVKLVFVEDQAVVETVFFLTSRTRALLRRFPRMLLVDRLPGLQGALDLLAVLCVDGAGRARQAACCVARPGTPSLLRFALASLLQSAPDVKGRVRCLTAGPEVAAQLPAVRQLLPGARVQICRAQGLETLFSKAQELGGAGREDPGLWPRLCRLAGASSPAAYAEALAELRAHGPAAFVDYFERNWAPRRDMWVRFRAFEAARDLDACALVRGHRRRLLRRLSPSRSVAQCLRDLVAMQWADAAGEAAPDVSDDAGCILSPCLFNLYAEYIMRNAALEEAQAGIKIAGRNINNLRYADGTTLMAESEEELKSFLMKVKEESEKVGLKLNIQKTKIMASGPITSWEIDGETVERVSDFISLGSKITADGDCSHEIKRCLLLGRKVITNLDSIFKSRDITSPTKVRLVKAVVFPVVMYGCESWTVKKAER
uniref:Zinc finger SWIM-type containing 9 n=1 Tax=Capra hircus TaxID=9925 RepID=A0A452F0F7_CAPHI